MDLDQIGHQFGTDKSSVAHDYLRFYERFFGALRTSSASILEIGSFDGASLKTWEAYFENSRIVGADINPATLRFGHGRIRVEILDQSNVEQLVALAVKHGPFDIIIEDGSHQWEHQITTLRTLFPFLKKGGFYIVEDLQTNYGTMQADYRGVASQSCVDYLKRAVDLRVADDQLDIAREEDAFLRTYARHMNLTFYRRACVIEKTYDFGARTSNHPGEPLIAGHPVEDEVFISAHIGNRGDMQSKSGSLRSSHQDSNIQGFLVDAAEDVRHLLQYRARLEDGTWTDWARCGDFVGTRGISQDLTGFSVALLESSNDLELSVAGLFRGVDDVVTAAQGEACAAPGRSALHGMQVIVRRK